MSATWQTPLQGTVLRGSSPRHLSLSHLEEARLTSQPHGACSRRRHLSLVQPARPPPLAVRCLRQEEEPRGSSGVRGSTGEVQRSALWRAGLCLMAAAPVLSIEREARAFGLSGPKDWLREQKKRTAPNLLKPIEASRSRLDRVVTLLEEADGREQYDEAIGVVRAAARDCMTPGGGAFQACTYQLILKNAASLVGEGEGPRLQADAALGDVITSFSQLDQRLQAGADGSKAYGSDVVDSVRSTQAALARFADTIKGVLGVPL